MKDYSQNGEQRIILDYFGIKQGTFLDIGANDGITLSNSRCLVEMGWKGILVEPAPSVFPILEKNSEGYPVECYQCAIGNETKEMILHESDSHLVRGDNNNLALLSSLVPSEIIRWGNTQKFEKKTVQVFTYKDFLESLIFASNVESFVFDFITIDAEGLDWEILKQIDLSNTQMVCIEWNQKEDIAKKISNYCLGFGFKLVHRNYENLIFTK